MVTIRSTSIKAAAELRGLAPIALDHLSNVVLLAGKNGSGKSRVLAAIEQTVRDRPSDEIALKIAERLPAIRKAIQAGESDVSRLTSSATTTSKLREGIQDEIRQATNNVEAKNTELQQLEIQLERHKAITYSHPASCRVLHAVPKSTELTSDSRLTDESRQKKLMLCYIKAQRIGPMDRSR